MKNLVLVRIDDRLIHGQVVTAWVKQTDGNRIIIVDTPLTKDAFTQRVLKASAPSGIHIDVMTTENAIEELKKEFVKDEKIIVLVKTPEEIEGLLLGGVEMEKAILGGMGSKAGRKKFNRNVSASPEEIDCLSRIYKMGVPIYYQLVPSQAPVDIRKLIE